MKKNKGFVHLVIIILVAIIAFSYFGIELQEVFGKPLLKKNLAYTWEVTKNVWTNYVYGPITGIFDKDLEETSLDAEVVQ